MSDNVTGEELDAYPVGTILEDYNGEPWTKLEDGKWHNPRYPKNDPEDLDFDRYSLTVTLPRPQSITEQRESDYGDAQVSFRRIAAFWTTYLGDREIKPKDVAAMMILLKVSRSVTSPEKADNWVDIAGYAELGERVE